jgi:hypothetical protein
MRYAVIDPMLKEKNIINIIEWEGGEWTPPRNTLVIPCPEANCGDSYNFETKEWTRHYIVEPEENL